MDSEKDRFTINRETVAAAIDHTLLKPDAVGADIIRLCDEALAYRFAAVCINPVFVPLAAVRLAGSAVRVCTVAGFPLGANTTETKAGEAGLAVRQGAAEIDMVLPIGALKEGKYDLVHRDITEVVCAVQETNPDAIVKVIIETCLLTDGEKVRACKIAEAAGARFVKTSTGFGGGGAAAADVTLMRKAVSPAVGVKASGGIRSAAQAVELIRAGASRLGTSSGIRIIEEIDNER